MAGDNVAINVKAMINECLEGNVKNDYLYNDKELWEDADLNWYDYGFRNYDPQIGRFVQLDPLTFDYEFLTPYQYASNDPITNIDIDGLEGGNSTIIVGANMDTWVYSIKPKITPNILTSIARVLPTVSVTYNSYTNKQGYQFLTQLDLGKQTTFVGEEYIYTGQQTHKYVKEDPVVEATDTKPTPRTTPSWCAMCDALDRYTPEQRAEDGRQYDAYRSGNFDKVSEKNKKLFDQWKKAHEENMQLTGVILGVMASPLVVMAAPEIVAAYRAAKGVTQLKWLRGTGGNINGFTISKGSGYGARPRFDFHKLSNTYNSRATSRMTIPKWLDGKKLPHWHRGKGNNLKYHRPWEIGPDGKRRW